MKPAQQPSRPLRAGDKLGKYELIRPIAIGGMAELYLARTLGIEGFEKLVVVKRILPQFVANATFVTMFLNEARLAATLDHPNIAAVHDIGVEAGDYFFAMEYVHGEDLSRIIAAAHEQGVPLSLDAALTLGAGLCAALHYAHERAGSDGQPLDIVHRDVSPSNVLVSYDGAVKLVDFGIARAMATSANTTQSGVRKGKVSYMSPEQCRARGKLDRRSDLFSVATVLYELTTGRLPFVGDTEYAVMNQIVNDDARPPSQLVPDYPAALERIVMRGLRRDPAERFADARALQSALEDFAHESRLRVSTLVLNRLMSTLFPARLEEWDEARAQGAFFVEQHVVRTLIESCKTPDPTDEAGRRAVFAAERDVAERQAAPEADDDTTAVTAMPSRDADTQVDLATVPPRMALPGEVPILELGAPRPRVAAVEPIAAPRSRSRLPIVAGASVAALVGGALAFVAFRADHAGHSLPAPGPSTPDVVAPPSAPVAPPPAPAAPEPATAGTPTEPVAEPAAERAAEPLAAPAAAPAAEPAAEPARAKPTPTTEKPHPRPRIAPHAVAKHVKPPPAPARQRPDPAPIPEPKEPSWNADSPFMPVRAGKP